MGRKSTVDWAAIEPEIIALYTNNHLVSADRAAQLIAQYGLTKFTLRNHVAELRRLGRIPPAREIPAPPSTCQRCGKLIPAERTTKAFCKIKWCSDACKAAEKYSHYHRAASFRADMGQLGASGEMLACADLLRRGYEVYRAVNPAGPYDLIVDIAGKLHRVEVKTARRKTMGGVDYSRPNKRGRSPRIDLVCIVVDMDDIRYKPALETLDQSIIEAVG